ncbi:MAG: diacylglycerol kinase family lipid kinase [Alphaproteobacteria bacterium]|nr:diacylglycerol kinase family lipid kinase [Alphaproteobacteria bacterium]MDE2011590.1 diacylglycerol kinase family lipid kinase [Alphaproteobacteria bacterium]MDE2071936.1 diacylglycerol kinase family lipid kinase [Alphaproteobacteria bacterium]
MSAFVVVNLRSGGGRTAREWPFIEKSLKTLYPGMAVAITGHPGQATTLVRAALSEGHEEIIAVGGDGTINEAVNGFFDANGLIAPDAVLSFVTSGTGGDLRKSFGIEAGPEAALARLKNARARRIDIGRVSCLSRQGEPVVRYFANIASIGLSGVIVDKVNRARIAKLFGGSFAFAFHSALAMLSYRERPVRLRIDQHYDEITAVSTLAVANGQYFGGGMRVAPHAQPDDGVFDIIVMGGTTKRKALADMKLIYSGEHLKNPAVRELRGLKVTAAPVAETGGHPVLIEVDGESAGQLPATFEILPRALVLRC